MAHDSVVSDDSKTVSRFFVNTCRLLQPSIHHVMATIRPTQTLKDVLQDDEDYLIPLTTGSAAEFYIQPMLSCVGDVDIMDHYRGILAIPAGHPPPTQLPAEFRSRVEINEIIDSEYPGYVYLVRTYLLIENTDDDKYDAVPYNWLEYLSYRYEMAPNREQHGPAITESAMSGQVVMSFDDVNCVRCLSWPSQAADWPTRHRNYGWPDSATVDRVVSNGCDVVGVAHRLCRQDEWMNTHQWRLSFSRAEIVLLNSWMPVQQIIYHMLRVFVKTERLTDITDSTGTKILSNYHIKTLMLWACEMKTKIWWIDDLNVVKCCVVLLHTLVDWLKNKTLFHYFVQTVVWSTLHYMEK